MHKKPLVVAVVLALVAGLSACSFGGNAQEAKQTNLANQRKAALAFLSTHGGVEQIRFTGEGGLTGFGAPWAVNALITIDSTDYQEILGTKPNSRSGQPLPRVPVEPTPSPVTVFYSDGSSETFQ